MLESDLRDLFERQAATKLRRAPISIPAARRIGRTRLLRRRVGAIGSPVVAAVAVVAVLLAGPFAAGPRRPAPGVGSRPAPRSFNPLVPYAAITWYPYRPSLVGVTGWRTALLLTASSRSSAEATEVMLYAAGWCTRKSASLTCGATKSDDRAEMTIGSRAPDVQDQAAYWVRFTGGNLTRLRALSGITRMLAFRYGRGGWAIAVSTGRPADVLSVAASVRYGLTEALRFPFRLTGLPSALSDVLYDEVVGPGPGAHAQTVDELLLGSSSDRPGTGVRDALTVETGTQTIQGPKCKTVAVQGGQAAKPGRPAPCPSQVVNGYRVYLNTPPVVGQQSLFAPDADGLYLYENTVGPHAPLTPVSVLAHHLQLLGPDPANWTTTPVSP